MAAIVADVLDRSPETALESPASADAEAAVARLATMATDLRGCAVIGADGAPLAASGGDLERWSEACNGLLAAADAVAGEPASHVHVATEDGEAFAVREGSLALVAVTERFTLASLILFDMRSVLRDLVRSADGGRPREREAAASARSGGRA